MKTLYKLHFDCGRQGMLSGLFIEDSEKVNQLIDSGQDIYFGEVLGKHSEVCGPLQTTDITELTNDPSIIKMVEDYKLCMGYNPFDYLL